jgi:ABC-type polysaccharide/polyol phosphate transport system ATPase subunit
MSSSARSLAGVSSDVAVRFDGISKRYRLRRGWYRSIRDEMRSWIGRVVSQTDRDDDYFYALKDVSFEIQRGDVVGLIGPNGAGKSTLLKILSRVTVPTSGTFTRNGRLGALIEIGAGFHPDLTGRENVYLNGAIMGMRRKEVDAKFHEIVAFAEVAKFIDTPVKYYSSGMQVRLGFSVAAHTDPEILLIDEVLAVGDASFQAKCLNRLSELKQQGRTIVLVSHNMANILQHSRKVLWLQEGVIRGYGDPESVAEQYLASVSERSQTTISRTAQAEGGAADHPVTIEKVSLSDPSGRTPERFQHGEALCIDIDYAVRTPVNDPVFEVTIQDSHGYHLGGITSRFDSIKVDTSAGRGTVRLTLQPILFVKGHYTVSVHIRDQAIERYFDVKKAAAVFLIDGPSIASRELTGHIVYPHTWEPLSRC